MLKTDCSPEEIISHTTERAIQKDFSFQTSCQDHAAEMAVKGEDDNLSKQDRRRALNLAGE